MQSKYLEVETEQTKEKKKMENIYFLKSQVEDHVFVQITNKLKCSVCLLCWGWGEGGLLSSENK